MWVAVVMVITACATQKSKSTATTTTTTGKTMPPAGTTTSPAAGTQSTTSPGAASSAPARPATGPKSFASFFDRSKLQTQKGLILVHFQDDKYYFEIPNSLMGKDFLTVTRYVRTTPGVPENMVANRQMKMYCVLNVDRKTKFS